MSAIFRLGAVVWAVASFWGLFVIVRSVMAVTGTDPLQTTSMATITFVIIWLMAGTISALGGLTLAKLAYELL